jgi:hypothetical protein
MAHRGRRWWLAEGLERKERRRFCCCRAFLACGWTSGGELARDYMTKRIYADVTRTISFQGFAQLPRFGREISQEPPYMTSIDPRTLSEDKGPL